MTNLVDILDRTDRACLGTDPELFFPHGPAASHALDICSACPIRELCLAYALERPLLFGIWGGTTADDRNYMRRQVA